MNRGNFVDEVVKLGDTTVWKVTWKAAGVFLVVSGGVVAIFEIINTSGASISPTIYGPIATVLGFGGGWLAGRYFYRKIVSEEQKAFQEVKEAAERKAKEEQDKRLAEEKRLTDEKTANIETVLRQQKEEAEESRRQRHQAMENLRSDVNSLSEGLDLLRTESKEQSRITRHLLITIAHNTSEDIEEPPAENGTRDYGRELDSAELNGRDYLHRPSRLVQRRRYLQDIENEATTAALPRQPLIAELGPNASDPTSSGVYRHHYEVVGGQILERLNEEPAKRATSFPNLTNIKIPTQRFATPAAPPSRKIFAQSSSDHSRGLQTSQSTERLSNHRQRFMAISGGQSAPNSSGSQSSDSGKSAKSSPPSSHSGSFHQHPKAHTPPPPNTRSMQASTMAAAMLSPSGSATPPPPASSHQRISPPSTASGSTNLVPRVSPNFGPSQITQINLPPTESPLPPAGSFARATSPGGTTIYGGPFFQSHHNLFPTATNRSRGRSRGDEHDLAVPAEVGVGEGEIRYSPGARGEGGDHKRSHSRSRSRRGRGRGAYQS